MSHSQSQPRLRHDSEHGVDMIPRVMIWAVGALMLSVLAIATFARVTDRPLEATPPPGTVERTRDVVLSGDMSGAAQVRAPDGTLIADLSAEDGGFVSGVWRVIERERTKHGADMGAPVTLNWMSTGRLSITDPETGWSADLMGFGADNARAFARLLAN